MLLENVTDEAQLPASTLEVMDASVLRAYLTNGAGLAAVKARPSKAVWPQFKRAAIVKLERVFSVSSGCCPMLRPTVNRHLLVAVS